MKTIEQKAKHYDEAIQKANNILEGKCKNFFVYNHYNQGMIEYIFSELKESEDERIRKELIRFVKGCFPDETSEQRKIYLAWLEKQGEKILVNSTKTCKDGQKPKFRVGDTIKCKYDDRQFTIKSVDLDKGTYNYTQEGCGNDIDYADEEFELIEQNHAWSEEDKKYTNIVVSALSSPSMDGLCCFHNVKSADVINWFKSLKERYTWKPSDEQIKTCKEVYADILSAKGFDLGTVNSELNRLEEELKKLK